MIANIIGEDLSAAKLAASSPDADKIALLVATNDQRPEARKAALKNENEPPEALEMVIKNRDGKYSDDEILLALLHPNTPVNALRSSDLLKMACETTGDEVPENVFRAGLMSGDPEIIKIACEQLGLPYKEYKFLSDPNTPYGDTEKRIICGLASSDEIRDAINSDSPVNEDGCR